MYSTLRMAASRYASRRRYANRRHPTRRYPHRSRYPDRRYARHHVRRLRRRRLLLLAPLILLLLAVANLYRDDPEPRSANAGKQEPREAPGAEAGQAYEQALTPETRRDEAPGVWQEKPEAVKGLYIAARNAGPPKLQTHLQLIQNTELNAVVVDVKDVTGEVMYPSKVPLANEIGATRDVIPDLRALVEELKAKNAYAIARVATFEDDILPRERPHLAVKDSATGGPWMNYEGIAWADAYNQKVWEYNVAIAKEAAAAGFDEIQFDYVRFPSDGPMSRLAYGEETFPTQEDAIAGFLEYARGQLKPMGVYVAADVFGLIATTDHVGVGQDIEKIAPHLDVLCPMVYPSHFTPGSYGFPNPNAEPYGVIQSAMADFKERTGPVNPDLEIRPWIQDFDLGVPPYGPVEIRAQIQAAYDAGETGWLLWNPSNEYTAEALAPEGAF